jgi:hypothetical protein
MVSTHSTFTQYNAWTVSQRNEARQRNETYTNRKRSQIIPMSRWYDSVLKKP